MGVAAKVILLKTLLNIELDEVMSERRPPTAGTFARLAVVSAIACVALPRIVDLAAPYWRDARIEKAPTNITPVSSVTVPSVTSSSLSGPRVMGAYQTVDDVAAGVDRFRFAAGSPFDEESVVPGARPDITGRAAGASDATIPDRMAPAAELEPAPTVREPVELPEASEPSERAKAERPKAERPKESELNEQHVPLEDMRPAPPAVALPDAAGPAAASPPATATKAAPPAGPAVVPVAKPVPVSRGEPRTAETQKSTRRKAASTGNAASTSRSRRQSASAVDEDVVAKPVWRPENLNNWPN